MEFSAWNRLQTWLQSIESVMVRRENVIRFLVVRFLLMLTMVFGFWIGVRHGL